MQEPRGRTMVVIGRRVLWVVDGRVSVVRCYWCYMVQNSFGKRVVEVVLWCPRLEWSIDGLASCAMSAVVELFATGASPWFVARQRSFLSEVD